MRPLWSINEIEVCVRYIHIRTYSTAQMDNIACLCKVLSNEFRQIYCPSHTTLSQSLRNCFDLYSTLTNNEVKCRPPEKNARRSGHVATDTWTWTLQLEIECIDFTYHLDSIDSSVLVRLVRPYRMAFCPFDFSSVDRLRAPPTFWPVSNCHF